MPGRHLSGGSDVAAGRRGGLDPVALPLKGVGGQPHQLLTGIPQHRTPIHRSPSDPELGQRRAESLHSTIVAAQRPHHNRLARARRVVDRFLQRGAQHRVGADLDECAEALPEQRARNRLELNRPARVLVPVLRIQPGRVERSGAHRRIEGHVPRARMQTHQGVHQPFTERLHMRRMHGAFRIRDRARPHTLGRALLQQPLQRIPLTGHHHRARPIHHRHRHPAVPLLEPPLDHRGPRRDRRHPTSPDQSNQRLDAHRHHPRRVFERQPASHVRGRDLTLGMTDDGGRLHATRPPQCRQRRHHGELHRLQHSGLHLGGVRLSAQNV